MTKGQTFIHISCPQEKVHIWNIIHKNAAGDTLEPSVRLERGGECRPPFRVSISVLKLTSYGSAETARGHQGPVVA